MAIVHGNALPHGQDEPQHGMAIFTHEQTAGKGQRGKNWSSEKDANIAISLMLNPYQLSLTEQFKLSVCVAVSVSEFFLKYAGDETKIKWPNDLYWRDRKAGGILIENVVGAKKSETHQSSFITDNWKWAVAGIGININQTSFPDDLPNPVSLKQISGKDFNPVELAKELCSYLEKNYQQLVSGDFDSLFTRYQDILYKKDESVKLKKDNRVFEATIKGVSSNGQLIVHHSMEERFDFGEVEWLLNQ